MIPPSRVRASLPAFLLLPVLLTGCGSEDSEAGASQAELKSAAEDLRVAPELIYVTEVPGFHVVQESAGAYGDDEFAAAYWTKDRASQFGLFVDHGTLTAENCEKRPLGESTKPVTCERDGDAWYRKAGDQLEYTVSGDGVVIQLSGPSRTVTRSVLRKAAKAVHRPDDTELAALLPS